MHITLVTHYFPPEVNAPAQRGVEHARIWVNAGHTVTIVTAIPSHPYGIAYQGYENKTQEEWVDGIRVLRLKTLLGANAGKIKRIANYFSFLTTVFLHRKKIGKTDIVISTSPQFFCGLAGYFVQRYYKAPWILEIRDIWPDSIVAVGAVKPSLATKLVGSIAKWAYTKANAIVSVSPGFADHFNAYEVPEEKVTIIPNGVTTDIFPLPASFADFPELAKFEGRFIAAFIGTLGMAHGLTTILAAAKEIEADDTVGILLVGSGAQSANIKQIAKENAQSNVIVLDQLPRERILKLWSLVSTSIVHLKRNEVFKTVIPTKLLEAMAMEKPVILGVEGTAAEILNTAQAGIAIEPDNSTALADAIIWMSQQPEGFKSAGRKGKHYVASNFDREQMALRYLALIETLLNHKRDHEQQA